MPSASFSGRATAKQTHGPEEVRALVLPLAKLRRTAWRHGRQPVQGLPRGALAYDFADAASGAQKAVFDLAWPNGIQEELSQPVAVLLNESTKTIAIASQAGYRCFTSAEEFRQYVNTEILAGEPTS